MTGGRPSWERVSEILGRAAELPEGERAGWVAEACAGDAALREEVEALLSRSGAAESFFEDLDAEVDPLREEAATAGAPERIGPYEVEEEIGRGGMGVVYRALDSRLGRPVALKLLPPWTTAEPRARERMIAEAKAASALDHPNIGALYDVVEDDDGTLALVLAYYEGETLAERLSRGPVPVAEAVEIAEQVARGLAAANEKGIVHRDVKPSNVMLGEDDRVRILDFGIAKVAGTAITRSGAPVGTAAYMSPEQASGEPVDHRTDLWSLGVMLHEMVSGRRPFRGDHPAAVARAITHDEPPPPRPPEGECPPGLERIVERALRKDPAERYPDAAALRADLAEWDSSTTRRAGGWRPRRIAPVRMALLALVGLVLIGVAAVAWWRGAGEPVEAPVAAASAPIRVVVLPFEVRGSPDFEYLEEGMVHLMAASLDGAVDLLATDPRAVLDDLERRGRNGGGPAGADGIAGRFGADRFVLGTVVEVEGRLRIQAALYPRGDQPAPLARAHVEGDVARLFDLVDELTSQLLVADRPEAGMTRVAAVTTTSIEAFKAYLQGDRARRSGRFDDAVDDFRRAVDRDSLFALAHYQLSKAAGWTRRRGVARRSAERAARHSGPLAPHLRDLLMAHRAYWRGDMAAAERLYRRTLASAPENVEGWYELGEVLFHFNPHRGRSRTEAREPLERALALGPDHGEPILHLLDLAAWEGDTARFADLYDRLATEGRVPLEWRAMRSVVLGTEADRRAIEAEIADASDAVAFRAANRAAIAARGLADVARYLRTVADPSRSAGWRARANLALAQVELGRGRVAAARDALESLRRIDPVIGLEHEALLALHPLSPIDVPRLEALRDDLEALDPAAVPSPSHPLAAAHDGLHAATRHYLLGLLSARLDVPEAAREHARRIERIPGEGDPAEIAPAFAAAVRAHAAWREGRLEEALTILQDSRRGPIGRERRSPLLQGAHEAFARAELLRLLGRDRDAASWYGAAADYGVAGLPYLAPAMLRRAEIAERAGDPARARAAYARFTELWADADPALRPRVRRAEARLREMEG